MEDERIKMIKFIMSAATHENDKEAVDKFDKLYDMDTESLELLYIYYLKREEHARNSSRRTR